MILLALAVALAWLGLWFHDAREFPGSYGLTGDSLVMGAIAAALLLAVWRTSRPAWATAGLLGFGLLMLVGGGLSVLPLSVLPFVPDQSGYHYLSHAVYAGAQVPLIVLCVLRLRRAAINRPSERAA